ncbi:MAG: hypothetical protein K1X78_05495 [Verrucomicrobiaceae bacterium]|nr:hypothetical protein [Verrucomicrobiaceae bacterium]
MQSIANWTCLLLMVGLVFAPLLLGAAKRQKYLRIFWRTWAGLLAWSVLCCLLVPLALYRVTGDKTVWDSFPEPAGIVAMALAGWLTAAILTVIVKSLFEFFYSRRDRAIAKTKPSAP